MKGKKAPHILTSSTFFVTYSLPTAERRVELVRLLGVRLDDTYARDALPDALREVGERRLHPLEPLVQELPRSQGEERDERHRDKRQQREPHVEGEHEPDGRETEDERVGERDDADAGRHPHGLDVVGRVRHEIAGLRDREVARREPVEMTEDVVPEVLFDVPGRPDDQKAPVEPEGRDAEREADDNEPVPGEVGARHGAGREAVHRPLDDPGDHELHSVNDEERDDPHDDGPLVPGESPEDALQTAHVPVQEMPGARPGDPGVPRRNSNRPARGAEREARRYPSVIA